MYSLLRPLLFQLDAEQAHGLAMTALDFMPAFCFGSIPSRPVKAMGLEFHHPIGLAAGLDKNGEYLDALAKVGFSFIEVGTVTPKAQIGNPKPRLFRLPEAEAIINRMGFNNHGVDALVENIKKAKYTGLLGINIGKNKDTPLADAAEDYLHCLQKVYPHASYITVNISSPNTPDLRQLQQKEFFADLLGQIKEEQRRLEDRYQQQVPLLVKVSPDENEETLKQMAEVILALGIEGIIATNTTCARKTVEGLEHANEMGGLSGKPLTAASTDCIRLLKKMVGDAVTLIGVGGIDNQASAQEKLDAGATLLQVYSGLIYQGPFLVQQLVQGLTKTK